MVSDENEKIYGENNAAALGHRSEKVNRDLVIRLNRIEGQVRGIKSMIERNVYCDDILTQLASAQSALNSVTKILLESHMKTCIAERIREGDEDAINEFIKTLGRIL